MANPKFAAAVAVNRNRGGIPNAKSLVGGPSSVGPEPKGDYDEVDTLHRALGSAIVDKIMNARKMALGGEVGMAADVVEGAVDSEAEDDFLSNDMEEAKEDYGDELDNRHSGKSDSEGDDETGEGGGGAQDRPSHLKHIMASIRKRHMGR